MKAALLVTTVVMLLAPAAALAAGPTMVVREIPLHSARTLSGGALRFNLLGVHWRGPGAVRFRTRRAVGGWSAWQTADGEGVQRSWHLGDLTWVQASDAVRFETSGRVTRLRAYYVWSPLERLPQRRLALAGAPPIIPRLSWGADESIRRHPPRYADAIHFAVIHHTAGSNDYSPAQSAAIVRGIEIYHVKGNGWWDIGYNFLVDKYGQVFEGRYGGVDKPVIGAHTQGFNVGSVGISVLGTYDSSPISLAAKHSLEQLLAWKLDLAHVDPLSTLTWTSDGNPRFPRGVPVFLRAISGHRDMTFTDCPGNALYGEIPRIAHDVAGLGLPKLYAPRVDGTIGREVHFSARLSTVLPWSVTIVSASGVQVAQGTGVGPALDWTWDAALASPGRYTWTMAAPNVLSASGTVGSPSLALALQKVAASPNVVVSGGDQEHGTTGVSYTLTAPATVTAMLVDGTGNPLATLFSGAEPAGAQSFRFAAPPGLANGQYAIVLNATGSGRTVSANVPITIDDIVTAFAITPPVFSPLRKAAVSLGLTLARAPTTAQLQVLRGAQVVSEPTIPTLVAGPQTLTWDGTIGDGEIAGDGQYRLALTITDGATTFTRTAPVVLDSTPPRIFVLSRRSLRFRLSEPATLTLVVGAMRYTRTLTQAGATQFWLRTAPRAYTLLATDAAGNTATVSYRS